MHNYTQHDKIQQKCSATTNHGMKYLISTSDSRKSCKSWVWKTHKISSKRLDSMETNYIFFPDDQLTTNSPPTQWLASTNSSPTYWLSKEFWKSSKFHCNSITFSLITSQARPQPCDLWKSGGGKATTVWSLKEWGRQGHNPVISERVGEATPAVNIGMQLRGTSLLTPSIEHTLILQTNCCAFTETANAPTWSSVHLHNVSYRYPVLHNPADVEPQHARLRRE